MLWTFWVVLFFSFCIIYSLCIITFVLMLTGDFAHVLENFLHFAGVVVSHLSVQVSLLWWSSELNTVVFFTKTITFPCDNRGAFKMLNLFFFMGVRREKKRKKRDVNSRMWCFHWQLSRKLYHIFSFTNEKRTNNPTFYISDTLSDKSTIVFFFLRKKKVY